MRTLVRTPDVPESGRRRSPNAGSFLFSPEDTARWQIIVGNAPKKEVELGTWGALVANHPSARLNPGLWQSTTRQWNTGRFDRRNEEVPSGALQKLVQGIGALPLRGDHDRHAPVPLADEHDLAALSPEERVLPRRTPMASQAAEEIVRATIPEYLAYMQRLAAQQAVTRLPNSAAGSP